MNPFAGLTYGEAVAYLARTYGEREALVWGDEHYSFLDLKREVDRASSRLASLGLKEGDKIGLWLPNRPEFPWVWFGASQMGLVTVILNTRLRRAEFEYQIRQSDARALVLPGAPSFRDFAAELAEVCPEMALPRDGDFACEAFPELRHVVLCDSPGRPWPGAVEWGDLPGDRPFELQDDPSAPATIAYSSGTTALPKGAMLSHCIWRKAWDGGTFIGLSPDDCLYLCVPLFGVLGSLNGLLTFWSHGARVVLEGRFDADRCVAALKREKCTAMHLLPAMIDALVAHRDYPDIKGRLRTGVVLSADPDVMRRTAEDLGWPGYVTGYGLTESTGLVARCHWDDPLELRMSHQGYPLPDCPLRVVDPETGRDLPPEEPGEIWIGGYSVMLGYYNKPEETKTSITPDGWLRSGDLGYLTADGAIKFLRRLKDGYKHKGFNVSTPEVEAVLLGHPAVAEAAVVGIPHREYGEIGIAFVVPAASKAPTTAELAAHLSRSLASFKVPAHIFLVDELPRTAGTDKIQKFKLKDEALARIGGLGEQLDTAKAG